MPKTVEELEKGVRRLEIKLEALVNFLQVSHLGPPSGRAPYDDWFKEGGSSK